jgi:HlyD family secretion protein
MSCFFSSRAWRVGTLLAFLLGAGCVQQQPAPIATPAATPLPAINLRTTDGAVKAAGKITPARSVDLSFPSAGLIITLTVGVGDTVIAGDQLAVQDSQSTLGAVAQAQAALLQAQARLAELQAGARPAEIVAAQANLDAAQARLQRLQEGASAAEIAAAQAETHAAEAALQSLLAGPSEKERIVAGTTLANAEVALRQAQRAYDEVAWRQDAATLPEAVQIEQAKNNAEQANALYAQLEADPPVEQVAAAQARLQQAQAISAKLQAPPSANQIAEAKALLAGAQAALELVQAGPRQETILAASAVVSETSAALQRAQADLAGRTLLAPISGTVTNLTAAVGQVVLPAQTIVTLADLGQLQVETTDLSERDVTRLQIGQSAVVFVDALNVELNGHVVQIAPQATVIGGDVVYTVTIALDEQPPALRWGMSVHVEVGE